ncbi:MAG: YbjQ family protein [Desulfobacterales bacterium]|nr:YbjQ family protein [Desulfobacterales bacterium]
MESLILNLVIFLGLLLLGYIAGTIAEKRHFRSIIRREKEFLNLPAITLKSAGVDETRVERVAFVQGSVVISQDYFKRLLAGIRNIFGGAVKSYETLLDRARREAILRMKEMAPPGTEVIVNMRIETSTIGSRAKRKNSVGSIEVLVYGTALALRKL